MIKITSTDPNIKVTRSPSQYATILTDGASEWEIVIMQTTNQAGYLWATLAFAGVDGSTFAHTYCGKNNRAGAGIVADTFQSILRDLHIKEVQFTAFE
jgi:hypothetical protein